MTWTYSGDPTASEKDELRFLVGDTAKGPGSLSDEEISYILSKNEEIVDAAIQIATQMGVNYTKLSDSTKKVGDLWLQQAHSAVAQRYFDLADRLRSAKGAPVGAIPFLDTTPKVFAVGMDDNLEKIAGEA